MLLDFKSYYKSIGIKSVWHKYEKRHIEQRNRIESPEINPCVYGQIIYDKGVKNIQ